MDQVIDADVAKRLHIEALLNRAEAARVVTERFSEPPPSQLMARFVTYAPTPYILLADTIAELRDQLPPAPE
jgi:hypothetical protein